MKNGFFLFSIIGLFISLYFGGIAYLAYVDEKMDEVFLNVSYSTIFLSAAIYSLHLKDEKSSRQKG
ncbi:MULTISPECIES: protein YpmT [Bacillaceae]|uniref:protein YpmT n=1 Tax=Bacillaceae TaxID=186817 RepID=UPI00115A74F5|nr:MULTISPECIES: protein YpmT [Bacillaceae]QNG61570.1 protein YpmT [Bacillus sp. PAMC26568]